MTPVPRQAVKSRLDNRLWDSVISKWQQTLQRQHAVRGEGGNKLRVYKLFKSEFEPEQYVKMTLPTKQRRAPRSFEMRSGPNQNGNGMLRCKLNSPVAQC